ncbi:class I adenylate-forming enzyme family protein [Williamsia sp. D3]|uniref:AMP-binding protein n=1 Tax=Williamsia sp. D3 TaxID=1313067 RepID=UPI000429ED27|nr:class I adenylate-forming enzyme family protein [Williamsia sp. D3]
MLDRIRDRAMTDPAGTALVDDRTVTTWQEVLGILDALGERLIGLASDPDERIAVIGENNVETLLAHAAAIGRGVGPVAVSRQLKGGEMADQLIDSGSVAVVTGPLGLQSATEAAGKANLRAVIAHNAPAADGVVTWADFLDSPTTSGATAAPGQRPARPPLVYTSGTTGRARGTEVHWLPAPAANAADFATQSQADRGTRRAPTSWSVPCNTTDR